MMTDATVAGAGGQGAGAGGQGGAGAGGAGGGGTPWHAGLDADTRGWAQNKGWLVDDPGTAFAAAAKAHKEAQQKMGVPPEELIRLPKPNAAEADLKVFWNRIGVPNEGKDYDLSGVKFADGSELDTGFADSMRAALLDGRVPKDRAEGIVKAVVKFMDGADASEKADHTAKVQAEQTALKTNWGTNFETNKAFAKMGLERLGQAAGLNPEQIAAGWDAISKVGGIGASYAMEMLRIAGSKMGEDTFVGGGGRGGGNQPMTREAARAEIDALKSDRAFRDKLFNGDREARRRMDNLHQIAYAPVVAA